MPFRVLRLVIAPTVGSALVAWWAIGDLAEPGGEDVLFDAGLFARHARSFGLLGVLIVAGIAFDQVAHIDRLRRTLPILVAAAGAGTACALGLRVATARSDGANIGGGAAVVVTPIVVVSVVVACVLRARRVPGER